MGAFFGLVIAGLFVALAILSLAAEVNSLNAVLWEILRRRYTATTLSGASGSWSKMKV